MDKWWVPGLKSATSIVCASSGRLPRGLAKGKPAGPTFREALETQYVCDAVLKSAKTQKWEKVAK